MNALFTSEVPSVKELHVYKNRTFYYSLIVDNKAGEFFKFLFDDQ